MANPHKGAVALEAGEKVYSLRFTTNSICELEDHFGGKPITEIVNELQDEKRVSMKMVRAVVWGALIDGEPKITLKDAGRVLDAVGMETMTEKLGTALQRFFPDQEEGGKARPPKAKAG